MKYFVISKVLLYSYLYTESNGRIYVLSESGKWRECESGIMGPRYEIAGRFNLLPTNNFDEYWSKIVPVALLKHFIWEELDV